jgi:hypothetical protein
MLLRYLANSAPVLFFVVLVATSVGLEALVLTVVAQEAVVVIVSSSVCVANVGVAVAAGVVVDGDGGR